MFAIPLWQLYQQAHSVEILTHGAVGYYSIQEAGYYGLLPMKEGILLLSGETETTLTYLDNASEPIRATISGLFLNRNELWITELGLCYYDAAGDPAPAADEPLGHVWSAVRFWHQCTVFHGE